MAEKEVKKGYTGFSNELVNDPIIKIQKHGLCFPIASLKLILMISMERQEPLQPHK